MQSYNKFEKKGKKNEFGDNDTTTNPGKTSLVSNYKGI
jgi:hypothetical protein